MGKSRFDKTCILCGEKYEYCGNCSRFANYPRWMQTVHNLNCKTILDIVMNFKAGVKSKDECKSELEDCDLTYRDRFNAGMNALIDAILVTEAKPEPAPKVDIIEEAPVEKDEPKVEEVKVEEKAEAPKEEPKANPAKVKAETKANTSDKSEKPFPKKGSYNFQKK